MDFFGSSWFPFAVFCSLVVFLLRLVRFLRAELIDLKRIEKRRIRTYLPVSCCFFLHLALLFSSLLFCSFFLFCFPRTETMSEDTKKPRDEVRNVCEMRLRVGILKGYVFQHAKAVCRLKKRSRLAQQHLTEEERGNGSALRLHLFSYYS